jgi:Domain of unknown function (DUF1883)
MRCLHSSESLSAGDCFRFHLNVSARVMLMDDSNFRAYQNGRSFRYLGGWAKVSPVELAAPHSGHWNAVVDLDGRVGSVRAGLQVIRN